MRIYVASSFKNKVVVADTIAKLRERGHVITHDWTLCTDAGLSYTERVNYLRSCADADYAGVYACDLLLLIDHPECRVAYTEMGMAIAQGEMVVVVGAVGGHYENTYRNVFMYLPSIIHVQSISDALTVIDNPGVTL